MRGLFTALPISTRPGSFAQQRASMIASVTLAIMVFYAVFSVFAVHPVTGTTVLQNAVSSPLQATIIISFYVVGFVSLGAVRASQIGVAELGPIVMVFLAGGLGFIETGFTRPIEGIALAMFIVFAGLLKQERGLVVATLLAMMTLVAGIARRSALPISISDSVNLYDLLSVPLGLLSISSLTYTFQRFAHLSRSEGTSEAQQDRLKLAQITTEISHRISRRLALNDVLRDAVEQVRESYPAVYHAQIFLIDDTRQNARLVASTGEVGKMLIERQHSLPVGSQSVIGQVTARRKPIVTRANAGDGIHRRNEFLPDTAVEAAFPMVIGDVVIGTLDLQSKNYDAFADDDVPIFQALADNIAIAIDNARLFEETEKRLHENQQLVAQTRQAAAEVERLNQRLTGRFWEDYLIQQSSTPGLSIDLTQQTSSPDAAWTPGIQQAIQHNQPIQSRQTDRQIVTVPLRVRGQAVGAMEFELDENDPFSAEDMAMIEEVSEQLGLAAESNRLFETSQRMAQREALVNEIATRLQSSSGVEMTLNAAARSLKEALKANKVVIRLGAPPAVDVQGEQA